MEGGTEAYPDLGRHCQLSDCHQLDFLPFTCHACQKVFCVEHRSCKSHECPKSDFNSRIVLVCEICSMSMETTGCPVKRCKGILTFSNTSTCKTCRIQVCLRHRFPADHACNRTSSSSQLLVKDLKEPNNKFLTVLLARNEKDCGNKSRASSPSPANPSVKAC